MKNIHLRINLRNELYNNLIQMEINKGRTNISQNIKVMFAIYINKLIYNRN